MRLKRFVSFSGHKIINHKNKVKMKNVISFISFVSAVSLAGIGMSEDSFLSSGSKNLALFAGLFFAVVTVAIVLSSAKNDVLTSKN